MRRWVLVVWAFMGASTMLRAQSFHYPAIPDSLTDRQERMAYLSAHFWDACNPADTTLLQEPKPILDFIYLLQNLDGAHAQEAVQGMVAMMSAGREPFGRMMFWLDRYLHDSQSPFYDDDLYLLTMEAILASDADESLKILPNARIEVLRRNRIGHQAEDFIYTDKDGLQHHLYDTESPLLLLVFNNPGCSLCQQTETDISNDETIRQLVESGHLSILAIAPEADEEEWTEHIYPADWHTGFEDKEIIDKRLYDIQRFPSLYLLDQEKRVILKEADYEKLATFLRKYNFEVFRN